jgi:hypothetical protein
LNNTDDKGESFGIAEYTIISSGVTTKNYLTSAEAAATQLIMNEFIPKLSSLYIVKSNGLLL